MRTMRAVVDRQTRGQLAVLAAFGVVLLAFLIAARDAVGPFVVALLVAYFMNPVVDALQRRGVPRWAGILLIYVVIVVVAVAALAYVVPKVIDGAAALSGAVQDALVGFPGWLAANGASTDVVTAAQSAVDSILKGITPEGAGTLLGPVVGLVTGAVGFILSYLFAPFFIFYLIVDTDAVMSAFDRGLPPAWRGDVWAVIGIANRAFRQWFRATIIQGLIMGTLSGISMLALNLMFGGAFGTTAVIIAIIAGLSEFIPIIGPLFPLIGATLVGLTISPTAALAAFIVFFILQQIEANIVAPRVEGEALALHPALIIAVLILGAAAAGLIGALLATVVTSTVLIITRYLFRRASGLIDAPPPPREASPPGLPADDLVPGIPRTGLAVAAAPAAGPVAALQTDPADAAAAG